MITIKVTQDNINKGIRESDSQCPIANSLKNSQKKSVSVGCMRIKIGNIRYVPVNDSEQLRIENFIIKFDSGYKVRPTTFRIARGEYSS